MLIVSKVSVEGTDTELEDDDELLEVVDVIELEDEDDDVVEDELEEGPDDDELDVTAEEVVDTDCETMLVVGIVALVVVDFTLDIAKKIAPPAIKMITTTTATISAVLPSPVFE